MNSTIDEHISRLVQRIQFSTLDVISDLAFGQPFGYIEQDYDVSDSIKITHSFFPVTLVIANIPSLIKLLHFRPPQGHFTQGERQARLRRLHQVSKL